ncbi:HNH endonuclease [Mycolicibacterium sp. PAM1]|nr:HNH endonuclease signature motif containing protein [Mycolicibacterium sp. PAM1]MBV5244341.1 HNH endonuclease [Mycolicibacterium sp. PAM1]
MAAALAAYRAEHPYCEHPDCIRLADDVDHVVPLAELPKGDPRRYDPENFMALCRKHHSVKTAEDSRRGKTRAR